MSPDDLNEKDKDGTIKLKTWILQFPFLHKFFLRRYVVSEWKEYRSWLRKNRSFGIKKIRALYKKSKYFEKRPLISIIMPVYNPDPLEFKQALESIAWQVYPFWELCIVDDLSDNKEYLKILGSFRDNRIKVHFGEHHRGIAETSQQAVQLASGDYIATMDQDDELYPDALFSFVNLLQDQEIDYFYSDKDMISPKGKRYMHFFKPDWSPEYLLSFNYVTHLEIFSKKLVQDVGGFRKEYEGSQDYDLSLRVTEKTNKIYHHPIILYSWRQSLKSVAANHNAKSYAYRAGVKAVLDAVKRRNLPVKGVFENPDLWRGHYRIVWDEDLFSDMRIYFIIISRDNADTNRVKELFSDIIDLPDVHFLQTNYNIESINAVLKSIKQEGYVFFCDDSVVKIISPGLIDMIGYLYVNGVGAVGCKFLDKDEKIFNVGLSISGKGKIIFNYRGSPYTEHGYGAVASVPRNVSAIFPTFWGCKISTLRERGYLQEGMSYLQASMNFFMEIIKSNLRIVCIPYLCLKVDTGKIQYSDEMRVFIDKWVRNGLRDKYYNPNLTDRYEDFGIEV